MNEFDMKSTIEDVLRKVEARRRKLRLLGATGAMLTQIACHTVWGVALYGIMEEDAGAQQEDGSTHDVGNLTDQ